ncbi:MAG: hypothetical protein ACRDM9_14510, partial [Gaiellaceae bacterium]
MGLARSRRRGLDLANLVREQVHLALAVPLTLVELGKLPSRFSETFVLGAERLHRVEVLTAGEPIQEPGLHDRG